MRIRLNMLIWDITDWRWYQSDLTIWMVKQLFCLYWAMRYQLNRVIFHEFEPVRIVLIFISLNLMKSSYPRNPIVYLPSIPSYPNPSISILSQEGLEELELHGERRGKREGARARGRRLPGDAAGAGWGAAGGRWDDQQLGGTPMTKRKPPYLLISLW